MYAQYKSATEKESIQNTKIQRDEKLYTTHAKVHWHENVYTCKSTMGSESIHNAKMQWDETVYTTQIHNGTRQYTQQKNTMGRERIHNRKKQRDEKV